MPDISKTDILFLSTCLEQLISHLAGSQSTRIANRIRMIKKLNNKLLTKIPKQ